MERGREKKTNKQSRLRYQGVTSRTVSEEFGSEAGRHKQKLNMACEDRFGRRYRWYDDVSYNGRAGCYYMRLVLQVTFIVMILMYGVHIYRSIEPLIHPVIVDFDVVSVKYQDDSILLSGTLSKKRACVFKGITVYGLESNRAAKLLDFEFLDSQGYANSTENRSKGFQRWGPWRIYSGPTFNRIRIFTVHECWPFWQTETKLVDLVIQKD